MIGEEAFIHPDAIVETDQLGRGTRVWAFTHVMQGASVGCNCNIGEQCFLEHGSHVGDEVVIKNGVALWEGVTLENRVFVGPYAVFTNDRTPRAKLFRKSIPTLVREGASIGANATIRCGVEIGRWAMIGAGAVVTRDVPDFSLVVGNPGRIQRYVCRCGATLIFSDAGQARCTCGLKFRTAGKSVGIVELDCAADTANTGGEV